MDIDVAPAVRSLARLDAWMTEEYERIQKWPDPDKYVPSSTDALYLYGRSFFLKDQPIAEQHKKAVDFFLDASPQVLAQDQLPPDAGPPGHRPEALPRSTPATMPLRSAS